MKIRKELICHENFKKINHELNQNEIAITITPFKYIVKKQSEIPIYKLK